MNNKAKEHFARSAIEDVFDKDPEYICNRLFEGSWIVMFDYITNNMDEYFGFHFPDPDCTDIATDWTDEDYEEHRIFVSERWAGNQMGYALQQAWEDNYYAVRYALKCGITLEDLE